ncbi:cobalamin biosynthesis protein CobD/CbiB [Saccharopolyspora lacisalsi]|uniref:Cobalamin biosynthesis protein CobD/CbiB n=1 Tax=Halosaccharopolyspora lacisalsi TaxID=1000566 RepID=A0A839DV34_9PSEU|nr:hypothetical protein [Halosaccharopolyspora lacisalsi]MBA8822678.1 cobalamin biosynthesis protein CobD/CbiB [Halosaccharopolyspora lacisalsi]MBA8822692.1 cobalamin biosynthesis protein CobD/CbiB [Halosaccharopolyspora lacisalsi]MBA8822703.1 cobalamin biosynthesis protein CobD/CbiB [Halosaccharopolyspora lacisalsi]
MTDQTPAARETSTNRRAGPDPITLTAGVLALLVTLYVLVGVPWSLQWVLAIGMLGCGVLVLAASLRRRDR